MKKFDKYITKKRTKVRCMLAMDFNTPAMDFNIPARTICECFPNDKGDIIYYNHYPICYTTSQVAKDYFWGYDENDPEGSIEWNKYRDKLIASHPDFSYERTPEFIKAWECFGGVAFFVGDNIKWQWSEQTLDSSLDQIKYLLKCIKEDKAPLSIFQKGDNNK